jgi:divalent metal cation (Fe/Co/Zn/Cd) transporter
MTTSSSAEGLTRRALRLVQVTIAYNVVEGVVAVTAGLAAGLVSVVGFGIDSGIESVAAVLVALRLSARLRRPGGEVDEVDEARERRTLRLVALTFYGLAAYVTVEGVRSLLGGHEPDRSPVSVALLVASLIVMPMLAAAKTRVGRSLRDPLILAEAAETRICVLLSASTLLGVGLQQLTGAGWWDAVAGFVLAVLAVREGREAWEGELLEDDDDEEPAPSPAEERTP